MRGYASWIVALWIFLCSKKLGWGTLCGYCFGNWSHKNIYEDCWVLPPCSYPSFLYLKFKCFVLLFRKIHTFLLKGQGEFAFSWVWTIDKCFLKMPLKCNDGNTPLKLCCFLMFRVDYKDCIFGWLTNWEKVLLLPLKIQLHVLLRKNVRMALCGTSHSIAQVGIQFCGSAVLCFP